MVDDSEVYESEWVRNAGGIKCLASMSSNAVEGCSLMRGGGISGANPRLCSGRGLSAVVPSRTYSSPKQLGWQALGCMQTMERQGLASDPHKKSASLPRQHVGRPASLFYYFPDILRCGTGPPARERYNTI